MAEHTDLLVIGGGPGGYAAAFRAADLGLDVTLVDPEADPGGVCLHRGCIPSKALLHVAGVIAAARRAAEMGVTFGEPTVELDALRSWKDGVVRRLTRGLGQLADGRGVRHARGRARFTDAAHAEIELADGGGERLTFDHAVIATGSRPRWLAGAPPVSPRVWDSRTALSLPPVPARLLVIGGGYIGLELGTVYAELGSEVSVVEMADSLLPGVDGALVRPLARRLRERFAAVETGAAVADLEETPEGVEVVLDGEDQPRRYDAVLIAVGRVPAADGLGLEHTAVRTTGRGFVAVDDQRRTAEPSIFAIGDVAGEPMLAHAATHEGVVAAEVAAGRRSLYEPAAIPAVVYTEPEIAWCGLTEADAERDGREVRITEFPWAASGRALTTGARDGLTRLICDPDSDRVLGVGICGSEAGELIAEGVLAVEMAALAEDVARSIHPHPTRSETLMEAAEMVGGQATHVLRKR